MSYTTKDSHYTAVIQISRVDTESNPGTGRGDDRNRSVDREVVKLTVRAKTLESLKTKIVGHTNLIDGDDEA